MQKLEKRKTYTPKNTSLVLGSVTSNLNKEETLSDASSKTFSNNSEENLSQHTGNQNLRVSDIVYVQNIKGQPLMPCKQQKANKLLKQDKAKVVKRKPFTIQLTTATGETTQSITLGVDAGAIKIGYSAVSDTKELSCGEVTIRTDIKDLLTEKRMYRRNRRNKLWYRQPRFNNRKRSEGWLAPSVQHKIDTHLTLINKIKMMLPVNKVVVEVAKFDTQKLENPDIEGEEYQQGQTSGYDNLRAFILYRDNYTCQICKEQGGIFDIHHIHERSKGGSNRSDNLVALHTTCHKAYHAGKIKHKFQKPKSFKETSIMNNIWTRVVDQLGCDYTFGYITKRKRINLGLEKSHVNDAFVITNVETQTRCKINTSKQIRRNNRQLQQNRKGQKLAIRRQRYKLQSGDIISFKNKELICNGMFNLGKYVSFIKNIHNIKYAKIEDVKVIKYGKGIQI